MLLSRGPVTRRPGARVLAVVVLAAGLVVGCGSTDHLGAPPTSAETNSASSGAAPALPRGNWTLDFTGAAGTSPNPAIFNARVGGNGWGNQELQSYTARPENASLDGDGHLVIRAVRGSYTGADGHHRDWTSARLDTLDKWAFTTGTLTVRMKAPTVAGMWPAFWLMGSDITKVGWPACGEVDVVELFRGDQSAHQTVHGPTTGGTSPYAVTAARTVPRLTDPAGWHQYSVTRQAGVMTFAIDGHPTGRVTRATLSPGQRWVFDEPMFVTLNLAVGGWSGVPSAAVPDHDDLLIDWLAYRT